MIPINKNRTAGVIVLADRETDAKTQIDTLCCVHCGRHFPKKPPKLIGKTLTRLEAEFAQAEGKVVRGTCLRCMGPTCGPNCSGSCVPTEQLLENMEHDRPLDFRPTVVGWTPELLLPRPKTVPLTEEP